MRALAALMAMGLAQPAVHGVDRAVQQPRPAHAAPRGHRPDALPVPKHQRPRDPAQRLAAKQGQVSSLTT